MQKYKQNLSVNMSDEMLHLKTVYYKEIPTYMTPLEFINSINATNFWN